MVENSYNKQKDLLKKIEDLMKCEICKSKYDYNIHRPLVVKCGHTFCKNCIYSSKQKNSNRNNIIKSKNIFTCPIDNVNHIFSLEKNINISEPSIYPNLVLEIILKNIMNINEPIIKEKFIVYSKPDMKRNKSPEINNKNIVNNGERILQKKKNENINIKINSGNQIINVNAINVNIDTGEKNKINKNNNDIINKDNNDSMLNDDLNTLQINEEMNINDKRLNFEKDKLNDDSIETIPYEEKSMTNMSFKDDFKELLNKNDELKYQMSNNLKLKTDENNEIFPHSGIKIKSVNNLNNINNIKNKQAMKAYSKKMLINENNRSSNKNFKEIEFFRNNDKDNIPENNQEIKEFKNPKNIDNENYKEKNSVYRNKKIKDLSSNNNKNKNNNSIDEGENNDKDEKKNSSKNYYIKSIKNLKSKQNEYNNNNRNNNLNKLVIKNGNKDILRKLNYHDLSDSKKILNMKTIASNNSINDHPIPILSAKSPKEELDKNNNNINDSLDNNESDNEKYSKNYRKNRTVFRQKKKIIYDENINENRLNNNTVNKNEENYKNESTQSLVDLNAKEKSNQINQYLFENSPNTYNKKSVISKNIYISGKNTISNSINKSNSSQNKRQLNSNDKTSGRKLDFENSNNEEIINSGLNNNNNSNNNLYNKRIKLSSIQKFKTINNSNSNNNLNDKNISLNNSNSNNSDNNSFININNSNSNNSNNNFDIKKI